jgi:CxxC-x17-CxxC domain-containing protein
MKNFNQGGNRFDKGDRNGGGQRWSGGGNGGRDREMTMHQATCSDCGKGCEVPFRPINGKPVYCKECFGGKASGGGAERFPRKEFNQPMQARPVQDGNIEMKRQLEAVNIKLDRLISSIDGLARSMKPVEIKEAVKAALVNDAAPKKAAKAKAPKAKAKTAPTKKAKK